MAKFEEKSLDKTVDLHLIKRLGAYTKPYLSILLFCVLLLFAGMASDIYRPKLVQTVIDTYLKTENVRLSANEGQGFSVGSETFVIDSAGLYTLADGAIRSADTEIELSTADLKNFNDYRLDKIMKYSIILALLVVLAFIATYFQQILLNYVGEHVIFSLRSDLFRKLESLDLDFYENNPVGRLVTRMTNDMGNISALYTEVVVSFLSDLALVVGSMYMMLMMDWRLALVSFAVLPIMILITSVFRKLVRSAYRVVRVKLAKINTDLNENFMGMKTIQIFNQEAKFERNFHISNEEYRIASKRENVIYAVFRPILNFLYYIALVSVILYGGYRALDGNVEVGVLVAFTLYIKMLFNPIMELAEKFNILQAALSSIERIFLLMDEKKLITEDKKIPVKELKGHIVFDHVDFSYIKGEPILKDVSFEVKPGTTTAFVGATGSGKSTIIGLLSRLYDVDAGAITIDGVNIKDYDVKALRSKISSVLQDVFLFSGDIRSNIRLLDHTISDREIMEAAEYVNADRIINKFSDGLDHHVVEGGATLSQGERQLLSFARAIVTKPDILILDEATSNIDTETEHLIQDAISKIVRGRTTFVVAHRLSTIQHADQIIVIHKGEIRERGTHDELLALHGLYYDLYELQYKER